ncbi:MAG: PaaI family thioesterase, partial [Rubrivivax sp.]|nr:PaaI family thioesterase [Rubrivivax sp.]
MNPTLGRISLPKLEGFRCFACGNVNPIGLHMTFYLQGDHVCSEITLSEDHAGWDSVAHGGILTTLLDEVMSWAVVVFKRTFFVTRTIELKFLRPVPVNTPLVIKGTIESMPDQTSCKATGLIVDHRGATLTRAWADIVYLPEKRLSLISPPLREAMLELFQKIAV